MATIFTISTTLQGPCHAARAVLCALAAAAAPVFAQTSATPGAEPEPGMWAFDGELNGQPGRSLQIDTQQGQGMIVSYLGYRADGSALFLQASGFRAAGSTAFTGDLQEFRNGPVIGGRTGNGEAAGSAGTVRLTFDTPTSGTVTLPGDAPRRISRFTYQALWSEPFSSRFTLKAYSTTLASAPVATHEIRLAQGSFRMSQLSTTDGRLCTYSGPYQTRGNGIESEGTKVCTDAAGTQQRSTYRAERFGIDGNGLFAGTLRSDGHEAFFMGPCLAGAVMLGSPDTCATGSRSDVAVQPGMWGFDDEQDGRPGRSLQIDTQQGSRALIVSYLGYRANGSALFLQGSTPNRASPTRYTVTLKEFRNGPAIGRPTTAGEEAATVGEAQLDFDSPTTGTVTLPGEAPRRISRFRYEDHSVRFDKAYRTQVYRLWSYAGVETRIDIVARNNVFRMDTTAYSPGNFCQYRGTYRLAGDGLASEGTRTCTADSGATTATSYRIEQFTVDRDGLLRGTLREADGVYLVMGGCANYSLCTRAELERPR
ncbi:hypothetical protein M5C99_01330 [Acidovorax sp. NCPPB 2350]|nr:hypothetical protein M5C99_01330 [Acidovorax sp. NCPPB 2350]